MRRVPEALRLEVRERAEARCEYCHKPEGTSAFSHHADHIIALKHGGETVLENLAWACFQCNTNKGSDLTTFDPETYTLVQLFHPRVQRWDDHFEMQAALILGKTAVGRATIQLLQINHPDQIETRLRLIEAGLW